MTARSNLLVIFGDQHRGEALGCAGNPDVQTPALDRLAAEGVRFTHAYANTPVCTPSRGSLLTGQWPHRHRALSNDLPLDAGPDTPAIARSLRAAAYRCGYIGKWHIGGWPRDRFIPPGPERLGFDDFWAAWSCAHRYFEPRYHLNDSAAVVAPTGRYEPEVQTDLALSWLGDHLERHDEQPFCLFLSYGPPHDPYWPAPPGLADRYRPEDLRLPPTARIPRKSGAISPGITRTSPPSTPRSSACCRSCGTAACWTTRSSSSPATTATCSARTAAGTNKYPGKSRSTSPCSCVSATGCRKARPTTCSSVWWMPPRPSSVCSAYPFRRRCRAPTSRTQIRGRGGARPSSVYLQEALCCDQAVQVGVETWRGVRTARYTYARDLNGPWMLYDNEADPYQMHNLAGDPTVDSLQAALETELQAWMERLDDPLEAPAAILARHGLTEAWAAREAHFRRG